MPPVCDNDGQIDEEPRSNPRPIELADSLRRQRPHISAFCVSLKYIRRLYFISNTQSSNLKIKVWGLPVETGRL